MSVVEIGQRTLVALMGCSGSGKTSFARRHFDRYQVLSSDMCRGLVADDENDQNATPDAFDTLYFIAGKRLSGGRLTVVDATNATAFARGNVVSCAKRYNVECVAIVFDLPLDLSVERAANRTDRLVPEEVIRAQHDQVHRSIGGLRAEGFDWVQVITSAQEQDETTIAIIDEVLESTTAAAPGSESRPAAGIP